MSTAVESTASSATAPSVEDAKTREQAIRAQLKIAKTEAANAKRAVTNAEKKAKSASDEEKPDAEQAVDAAKDTLATKTAEFDRLEAEAAQAKKAVTEAREVEKAAKAKARAETPKKASLTLSQRRALLKLGDGPVTPHTAFNQLPLQHLVRTGLAKIDEVEVPVEKTEKVEVEVEIPEAERTEGGPTTKTVKETQTTTEQVKRNQYSLTELGESRVGEINPKWKTWRAPSQSAAAVSSETPVDDNGAGTDAASDASDAA